jgi:hypothetical protein
MDEVTLPACPLCGHRAIEVLKGISVQCASNSCPLSEPVAIDLWKYRPLERILEKRLNKSELDLKKLQDRLDEDERKFKYITDLMKQITVLSVTIILKNGKKIDTGMLAQAVIEKIEQG